MKLREAVMRLLREARPDLRVGSDGEPGGAVLVEEAAYEPDNAVMDGFIRVARKRFRLHLILFTDSDEDFEGIEKAFAHTAVVLSEPERTVALKLLEKVQERVGRIVETRFVIAGEDGVFVKGETYAVRQLKLEAEIVS